MKKAEQSGYILIKAYTDSEWDGCEFAVIHITHEWKKILAERIKAAQSFKEDGNFSHLSYWGSPVGFYKDGEDETQQAGEILEEGKDWCFVELHEGELESLTAPENSLGTYQMIVDKSGAVYYKAYGKHTSEEFYTAELSLPDLLTITLNNQ